MSLVDNIRREESYISSLCNVYKFIYEKQVERYRILGPYFLFSFSIIDNSGRNRGISGTSNTDSYKMTRIFSRRA